MSKTQKGYDAKDFKHVTPQMIEQARRVVADREGRRYSTSNIYKAHNGIFNLKEPAQTCDTCLVLRSDAVAKWLKWYDEGQQNAPQAPVLPGVVVPMVPPVAEGTVEEAVDYPTLVAKYALPPSENDEEEIAALAVILAGGGLKGMTAGEVAIMQARHDELAETLTGYRAANPVAQSTDPNAPGYVAPAQQGDGMQPLAEGAVRIILQKVNKDNYAETDGDALYADKLEVEGALKFTNSITGKALQAGTYATEDPTQVLGVQPGGKGTYKPVQ